MNSDSESQDSDDGRRFRFATTRKDGGSHLKKTSSQHRYEERRSRSRDRSSRYREDSSHKDRSTSDKDTNNKHITKDSQKKERNSRELRSNSRDRSSRKHREKESRSQRRNHDSKERKNSSSNKHKSKSKEKHKKRSRDRSREKSSNKGEEIAKSEKRKVDFDKPRVEEDTSAKKQCTEGYDKVNLKNTDKNNSYENRNSKAILGDVVTASVQTHKKSKSYFERVVKKNVINDDNYYGPVLPPKLEKDILNARDNEKDLERTTDYKVASNEIGPTLPGNLKISSLSEDSKNNKLEDKEKKNEEDKQKGEEDKDDKLAEEEEEVDEFGPALPPHLHRRKIVGPVLPDNFDVSLDEKSTNLNLKSDSEEEEDPADVLGPLPADHPANQDNYIQLQLEYRARKVKAKFMEKTVPEKNKREEWMTELPPAHALALGLGSIPRKFKSSEGPDMSDRSMWTDTPSDKLKKQKEKEENRFVPSQEASNNSKNNEDSIIIAEERKGESLLDLHLKTLKKKKKKLEKEAKELGLSTRKPFNRDEDLQTNRLDQARKKKIFEKASRLNDRFTVGKM